MKSEIDEIVLRVKHRDRVFEEWRVDAKGARQSGIAALFVGPSGTGKTLAAEVVAARLSLDLYSVDLSQLVSKYIGETEKNLARVFDAAEECAAMLFFDEADGVFGKRTETHNAHDRYANLEASYLLTRLETFTGLCILASNFRQNIDSAFTRRMDFILEFGEPDAGARADLWRRHLICSAAIARDVDPVRLGALFPVSGGHIRNAVVTAAFRAAEEGRPIAQSMLIDAMHREYRKIGRAFPSLPAPCSDPSR